MKSYGKRIFWWFHLTSWPMAMQNHAIQPAVCLWLILVATVSRTYLIHRCQLLSAIITFAVVQPQDLPQMQDISAQVVLFTSPPKKERPRSQEERNIFRTVFFVSPAQLTVPCRQKSQDAGDVYASLHPVLDAKAMPGKDNMKHQWMDLDHRNS